MPPAGRVADPGPIFFQVHVSVGVSDCARSLTFNPNGWPSATGLSLYHLLFRVRGRGGDAHTHAEYPIYLSALIRRIDP